MKILFVDLEREWRGGQSQAFLTLRGLREKKHDVELLAARNSPLAQRVAAFGTRVHGVSRAGLRLRASAALHRLLALGKFELVHLNEPHAVTAAWIAGANKHVPVLFSRRIGFPLQKNWVSRRKYRDVYRFLPNCQDVAQSLLDAGITAERMSIVKEGVELPPPITPEKRQAARQHWGLDESEFAFGCTSVFVPEKGQRHAIEALAEVRAQHPATRLLFAGDGKCRGELEALCQKLGQRKAVIFAGFVENVDQVYAALDAFVFPSEFEGTGTALQAAMAWQLPCISTSRGGLKEVVDNEQSALVAEPDGKSFAVAMLRLLENADLRQRLGFAGRREVELRFSAERMVDDTLRVYEEVLQTWRRR